jgi:branched-chain amino acid transport system ATP-binding protein
MSFMLEARNITAGYGNRRVLHDVSLSAEDGERLLLIGPNGSGKSTLLKTLAGILHPEIGMVTLKGKDITKYPTDARIRMGMGYLKQTRNIFPSLSVEENLNLSNYRQCDDVNVRMDWVLEIFPFLKDKLGRRAGLLSGGERQALAIGMILMRKSDILLIDEPTAGLAPKAAGMILEAIHRARESEGFSYIIVEHNLKAVCQWVSRVLILNEGRVTGEEKEVSRLLDRGTLEKYYFG